MNFELNKYIDHTILKPTAAESDIIKICQEAKKYFFKAVCVNPCWVKLAAKELKDSGVLVCAVAGFPLGVSLKEVKANESELAIQDGADEIDMVINIGFLKSDRWDLAEDDIKLTRKTTAGKVLKVIVEAAYLTLPEKERMAELVKNSGADFIKTSTGFALSGFSLSENLGASIEDVKLFKKIIDGGIKIKAAGGIKTREQATAFIEAGADRLGTSSGAEIIN